MAMKSIYCIILTAIFLSGLVFAESPTDQLNDQYYARYFTGWKGIVFTCNFDAQDKILEQIYQQAMADVKMLTSTNDVQLIMARSNDLSDASSLAKLKDFIILEYDLISTETKDKDVVKAVHARLFFKISYLNAVDNNEMPGSLGGLPRPGNLEIWERTQIGKGRTDRIAKSFANHAKQMFRQALSLFSEYSK